MNSHSLTTRKLKWFSFLVKKNYRKLRWTSASNLIAAFVLYLVPRPAPRRYFECSRLDSAVRPSCLSARALGNNNSPSGRFTPPLDRLGYLKLAVHLPCLNMFEKLAHVSFSNEQCRAAGKEDAPTKRAAVVRHGVNTVSFPYMFSFFALHFFIS